jgi:hypothetical protein
LIEPYKAAALSIGFMAEAKIVASLSISTAEVMGNSRPYALGRAEDKKSMEATMLQIAILLRLIVIALLLISHPHQRHRKPSASM